jgi:D-arabinonate dehydratase
VHAHLLASIPNGWPAEYFLPESGILNFEQLLENPLQVKDGVIQLDDEPGHGIRVNMDAVQTFLKAGAPPRRLESRRVTSEARETF